MSTLTDAGIKVLHILLLRSGLQEFIGGFGLIGGGAGIHNTRIANAVLLLCTEVSNDYIPLWILHPSKGGLLFFPSLHTRRNLCIFWRRHSRVW